MQKRTTVTNEHRAYIHANKGDKTPEEIATHLGLKLTTIRPHLAGKIRKIRKERKPPPPPKHDEEPIRAEDLDLANAQGNFDIDKWAVIAD